MDKGERRIGSCEELDLGLLRITLEAIMGAWSGDKKVVRRVEYAKTIILEWVDQVAGDDHRYYKKALGCIESDDFLGALKWINKIEEV